MNTGVWKCFLSSASEKLLLLPVIKALVLRLGDESGRHSACQAIAGVVRCSLEVLSLSLEWDEDCAGPADCQVGQLTRSEVTGRYIQAGVLEWEPNIRNWKCQIQRLRPKG